jgi:PAS domain-containing protein
VFEASRILVARTGDFSKIIDDGTQREGEHAIMLSGAPQMLAQTILDTLREPILVLDVALRVKMANRSFYRTFRVRPEGTESKLIYELGDGQWNIPKPRVLLGKICFGDRTASMPIVT